jgi:hypothetical protein
VTEPHVGRSEDQIAQAMLDTELDITPATAVVIDAVAKFRRPVDHREMNDVYTVISESSGGQLIVRTVHAFDQDDARRTHQENYADESIVEVHQ